MSQLEVDKVIPQSGTTLTLGESGDTVSVPSGATLDASNATLTLPDDSVTTAKIDDGAVTSAKITYPLTTFSSTGIDDNATANALTLDSSGNLQFNSGFGSVATAYGCRAWINFNGSGTPSIRGSGNVSSITDNGTGDYTVNFTTAMPDVNYSFVATSDNNENGVSDAFSTPSSRGTDTYLTSSVRFSVLRLRFDVQDFRDATIITVAIFR
jgi:hypothetical protein